MELDLKANHHIDRHNPTPEQNTKRPTKGAPTAKGISTGWTGTAHSPPLQKCDMQILTCSSKLYRHTWECNCKMWGATVQKTQPSCNEWILWVSINTHDVCKHMIAGVPKAGQSSMSSSQPHCIQKQKVRAGKRQNKKQWTPGNTRHNTFKFTLCDTEPASVTETASFNMVYLMVAKIGIWFCLANENKGQDFAMGSCPIFYWNQQYNILWKRRTLFTLHDSGLHAVHIAPFCLSLSSGQESWGMWVVQATWLSWVFTLHNSPLTG